MVQILIETLLRTSDLALVALGLSMVYGLAKFPNIAHPQYAMVGAYLTYVGTSLNVSIVGAIILSSMLTGVFALTLHRLVFQRLIASGPAIAMIGSLAVSMLIVAGALGLSGSFPRMFDLPLTQPISIADASVPITQLYTVGVTIAALILFWMLWFHTRTGRAMRALASNRALADASGLNAQRIVYLVNFTSGALAGLGGSALALSTGAHINMGHDLLLPVFAAAILGGLGNPIGAVAGAFLIALAETIVTNTNFGWMFGKDLTFLPISYISAASFLILLLALLFRPYGLFDREVRRV